MTVDSFKEKLFIHELEPLHKSVCLSIPPSHFSPPDSFSRVTLPYLFTLLVILLHLKNGVLYIEVVKYILWQLFFEQIKNFVQSLGKTLKRGHFALVEECPESLLRSAEKKTIMEVV